MSLLLLLLSGTLLTYDRLFRKRVRDYGTQINQAAHGMLRGAHEGLEGLKEIRILSRKHFHKQVRRGARGNCF